MSKMFLTYTGGKRLNVREAPGGAVTGAMFPGESAFAERIDDGWAKLEEGGYVNVAYCSVELAEDGGIISVPAIAEPQEAPGEVTGAQARDDLEAMTVAMLRDLAESRGIDVKRKASKPELVDAILNG